MDLDKNIFPMDWENTVYEEKYEGFKFKIKLIEPEVSCMESYYCCYLIIDKDTALIFQKQILALPWHRGCTWIGRDEDSYVFGEDYAHAGDVGKKIDIENLKEHMRQLIDILNSIIRENKCATPQKIEPKNYFKEELMRLLAHRYILFSDISCEKILNDKEFIKEAIISADETLKGIPLNFRKDKDFMMEVIKHNCWWLHYASDELKNDREVVMAAVTQDGRALEFASHELRNDKDVVLEAVKQNGFALADASDELKNDKEVVMAAVEENRWALRYASDELQNDTEFLEIRKKNILKYLICKI